MSSKWKQPRRALLALISCSGLMMTIGAPAVAAEQAAAGATPPQAGSCLESFFRLQPVFGHDGFSGLRLYPGDQRDDFIRLGFTPGDLFVGKAPVKTLESLMQELEMLLLRPQSSPIAVPIVRSHVDFEVTIPLDTAAKIFTRCK